MSNRQKTLWGLGGVAFAFLLIAAWALEPKPPKPSPPVAPAASLPRAVAQLPSGIRVIPEPEGFLTRDDVLAGNLALPSGRLAIDDFYYGEPQLTLDVPAGEHELRVTRADSREIGERGGGVALVTLITGSSPPVRWRQVGGMGTDGGTGGFASAEAAERMVRDQDGALHERHLEALDASRADGVAEVRVGPSLNLFAFSPGLGDGGYAVYAGTDHQGRVVRVVLDGGLLHLAWPAA